MCTIRHQPTTVGPTFTTIGSAVESGSEAAYERNGVRNIPFDAAQSQPQGLSFIFVTNC